MTIVTDEYEDTMMIRIMMIVMLIIVIVMIIMIPILVTPVEIVTDANDLHPRKAYVPRDNDNDVNDDSNW